MSEDASPAGLGLVEFLADLRGDLEAARAQAIKAGGELRLGVEEVRITLEVAHERTTSGEVGGKVAGKFWVFGSAEASGKGGLEATRSGTQTLTLTMKPRVEATTVDEHGQAKTTHVGLDVHGAVGAGEQHPPPPAPSSSSAGDLAQARG
jgi:hypothetical protein